MATDVALPESNVHTPDDQPGARVRARARVAITESVVNKLPEWAQCKIKKVATDNRKWWGWHGTPLNINEMWAQRIPNRDRVPARNAVLWWLWIGFQHAWVLPVTVFLYIVIWTQQEPWRAIPIDGVLAYWIIAEFILT